MLTIDAKGLYYADLNQKVKNAFGSGTDKILLKNVNGQRYIGTGISGGLHLTVDGTPGNDMAAYLDGPTLIINGNAQDAMGNTMNNGTIVVHGNAGDTVGYAMRGGEIYVRGNVGYRVGIHMKEYRDKIPVIVIGGKSGDFFGEYMAGGILILLGLGLKAGEEAVGDYCGTGMHGGVIYIRGEVDPFKLGKEVKVVDLEEDDYATLDQYVTKYCAYFQQDPHPLLGAKFSKLIPFNKRPYGNLYAGI